jgi:hypothetical protein
LGVGFDHHLLFESATALSSEAVAGEDEDLGAVLSYVVQPSPSSVGAASEFQAASVSTAAQEQRPEGLWKTLRV